MACVIYSSSTPCSVSLSQSPSPIYLLGMPASCCTHRFAFCWLNLPSGTYPSDGCSVVLKGNFFVFWRQCWRGKRFLLPLNEVEMNLSILPGKAVFVFSGSHEPLRNDHDKEGTAQLPLWACPLLTFVVPFLSPPLYLTPLPPTSSELPSWRNGPHSGLSFEAALSKWCDMILLLFSSE